MRALGYRRISKDEEGSVSLDYQKAEIEKLCEREGLTLIGVETDEGISGKSIKSRPAVQRVLQAVDKREIDCVVVYKSDRMSRDGIESLQIEKLLIKRGVDYWSATEGRLTDDNVESEFLSYIRAGLNQRERKLIAMRTRQALARKKEKGDRVGGRPRYGWKVEDGQLIEDATEQEAIRRMKALKAKGYTQREIVEALQREGIRNRKGGLFNHTQICRILKAA